MKFGCRETGDHEKEDLGMAILINEEKKLFTLNTKNTTYQMKVIDYGYLAHLYYGKKMDGDMSYVITHYDRGFSGNPYEAQEHSLWTTFHWNIAATATEISGLRHST